MRARATAALGRLDAILEGTPDPVTGQRIPVKPETWLATWGDIANRGYGRPHQSLDVTSGGEAIVPGVVFLPTLQPLPPADSPDAIELDEGADLNPLRIVDDGAQRRLSSGAAIGAEIEAGRASGELPR
jgi:hypothetical protein